MAKAAAKPDFVSFRPGDLSVELLKRATEADMSVTAKSMLRSTFALLRAESARLQKIFSSAEMQVIAAALYDDPCEPEQVINCLRNAAETGSGLVGEILHRYRVDNAAFLEKVRALEPAAAFAIADSVWQLRRLPMNSILGLNGLPSLEALRRVGLVAIQGPAAWGYCVVRLADYSDVEYILRHDPTKINLDRWSWTIEKLASKAVDFSRATIDGRLSPDDDIIGFSVIYRLSLDTGLRYFRIEEGHDNDSAKVIEISRETLMHGFHDGSLKDLVLAGVNAPDDAPASGDETAPSGSSIGHPKKGPRVSRRKTDPNSPTSA